MSLFDKKNFKLELQAEGIVRKWTESIENVACTPSAANDVIVAFNEGKSEIDQLKTKASPAEKNMLLDDIAKLAAIEKKKLNEMKEIKVETPSLFNKPKGAALPEKEGHAEKNTLASK